MHHRAVSPIEMYSVGRNQLNFYTAVISFVRMKLLSNIEPFSHWKNEFEKALRSTIEAQPRLQLQIDIQGNKSMFVILPETSFENLPMNFIERDNVDDENEIFLNKIVEQQSNRKFTYNQMSPLWELTIIFSSASQIIDLLFTFNHAIADGISSMAFFSTFLRCLANKPIEKFSLDNDPPVHELIPSKLPPLSSFISSIFEKLLLPKRLSQYLFPKTYWSGFKQLTGEEQTGTRLISLKLSPTEVDLLHKKCRREQTTIHSAIVAAALLSITSISRKETIEFLCGSAVDLRRFCNPVLSREQIGDFVSAIDTYHYLSYRENLIELFWPLTRQIKEQITRELEHSVLPMIQTLKFVSNWQKLLQDMRDTLPNGFQHSVEVSNIVRWTFDDSPTWKITHGGFTQTANIISSPLTFSVVTVNNVLNIYISFRNFDQETLLRDRMRQFLLDSIQNAD